MRGLLLIAFFAFLTQASALTELNQDEVDRATTKNNLTLIFFVGGSETQNCQYVRDFKSQMEYVEKQLKDENITVAMTNTSYSGVNHGNPMAVFYQRNPIITSKHENLQPIPITWTTDGREIVNWVRRMIYFQHSYNLTTKADYDYFTLVHKTLFLAYFDNNEAFYNYDHVAREFPYPFVYTNNLTIAKELLKVDKPTVFVIHNWEYGKARNEFSYGTRDLAFTAYNFREWVKQEIRQQITEIRTLAEAAYAFSSTTDHIVILFAPKSGTKEYITDFAALSKNKIDSGKFTAYYADSENSGNRKLMELLDVTDSPAIVLVRNHNNLSENPFTKRCSSTDNLLVNKKIYKKESMIQDYKLGLDSW